MSNSNPVIRKKRGRPASGQDPILSFRLPLHFKQTIDRWRSTERDKPSRSEAIRWLIGQGLTAELKKRVE
jgi:Arc/MetJ-type ribon-helix-helix transcriptional regulator